MSEQRYGKVVAKGNATQIALVKLALDECIAVPAPKLQDRLPADYTIEFKTADEMVASGAVIPGTTDAAWGYVKAPRLLWVNADVAQKKPATARHITRHEIAHILPMTALKRLAAMLLMFREDGTHPTDWTGGSYKFKPRECWADSLAEAMSGKDSPWDDFAYFGLDVADTDLPTFVDIAFRADPSPPLPDDPPPPLPPPDPALLAAQARVVALEAALTKVVTAANQAKQETGLGGG